MKKIILTCIILVSAVSAARSQTETTSFTGPGDVCYPQTIPLYVVNPNPNHYYQWYRQSDACGGFPNAAMLNMGTTCNANASGMYYFTIFDQNFMPIGQSSNANLLRVLYPGGGSFLYPPRSSNGLSLTCHASPAWLCINSEYLGAEPGIGFPPPTTIIKWFRNGQIIAGASDGSYQATLNGYYKYSINNGICETSSDSALVTLAPPAVVTPSGPTTFCTGDSVILNANTGAGFTYQWKKGLNNIFGATSSSYAAKIYGGYYVLISNGSCTSTSNGFTVYDETIPTASITPAGSTTFCTNGSVLLNANSSTGLSHQWKNNGTNISGETNSTYAAAAAGSYTVVVTNSCGSVTSSATTVTVNSLPSATITPAGPTTFCSGGSVVLNAPVSANRNYQWKKGVNLISGATLSSYTATTGGNYRVIVTNTVTGCSKTTGSATVVTVNALPAATITPQGPTTFCAGGSLVLQANTGTGLTYKWKKGSNFISGATLSNYTATTGGNYRVQVTNSFGCSKTSALVSVSVPCKEGESLNVGDGEGVFDVNVYPNPNSGEFTIEFSNKPSSKIQIELTDEIGKVVKRFETDDETVVINESNLAKGIYCLTALNNNGVLIKKINIVK